MVADDVVVGFFLPEWGTGGFVKFVYFTSGAPFPLAQNVGNVVPWKYMDNGVDMVWHDAPRQVVVNNVIVEQHGIADDFCGGGVVENTRSMSTVQPGIDSVAEDVVDTVAFDFREGPLKSFDLLD